MSTWERTGRFYDDCDWGTCKGHTTKLELQDTAEMFTYYVDGVQQWLMSVDEMTALHKMVESMEYL